MRIIRGSEIDFIPASHEDQKRPGVLKRVLARREELQEGHVQMINWAQLPAGSSFRPHYHEDMEEIFIMISGRVSMTVDEATHELLPGDAIVIQPREVHEMKNLTDEDLEYIVVGISSGEDGQTVVV